MTDAKKFGQALVLVAEIHGKTLSHHAIALYWKLLSNHPIEAVLAALEKHMRDPQVGQHMPKPADIIRNLPDQSVGADEAWAKAIAAGIYNEDTTIIIERAIFGAFPFALYNQGDKIGARMAFKDKYPRLFRKYGKEIHVSLGLDPKGREEAILEAHRNGLLTEDYADRLIPYGILTISNRRQQKLLNGAKK